MTWSFWIMAAVVLFMIEILTPGAFFFACLGIGAAVAGLAVFLLPFPWLPWITFAIVSLISIYTIRPLARRFFQTEERPTNVDALIGQTALVTENIEPPRLGTVKVEGEIWRAEASGRIEAGRQVKVMAVKGTRLEVQELPPKEGTC